MVAVGSTLAEALVYSETQSILSNAARHDQLLVLNNFASGSAGHLGDVIDTQGIRDMIDL